MYKKIDYDTRKMEFFDRIRVDKEYRNLEIEKKNFMNEITENESILEKLSINRLEMILQYYVEENNKKRAILNKLDF